MWTTRVRHDAVLSIRLLGSEGKHETTHGERKGVGRVDFEQLKKEVTDALNQKAAVEGNVLNQRKVQTNLSMFLNEVRRDADTKGEPFVPWLVEKWYPVLSSKKIGYVVEGFNDEKAVLEVAPHAFVVVTKGTRFNTRVKMDVRLALDLCDEVYVLTDPDEQGEHLARLLMDEFPSLKRLHVEYEQSLCMRNRKLKVGVEHCDPDYLKEVLGV